MDDERDAGGDEASKSVQNHVVNIPETHDDQGDVYLAIGDFYLKKMMKRDDHSKQRPESWKYESGCITSASRNSWR